MTLTPEQRAALEWAVGEALRAANLHGDRGSYMMAASYNKHVTALQALLDEKGGDGPEPRAVPMQLSQRGTDDVQVAQTKGSPVAGAASTAPPDSPAKIAAHLRENYPWSPFLQAIAARVEALGLEPSRVPGEGYQEQGKGLHYCPHCAAPVGLEPSEREVVAQVCGSANRLLDYLGGVSGTQPIAWLRDDIIAALAPIAEKGAGT